MHFLNKERNAYSHLCDVIPTVNLQLLPELHRPNEMFLSAIVF